MCVEGLTELHQSQLEADGMVTSHRQVKHQIRFFHDAVSAARCTCYFSSSGLGITVLFLQCGVPAYIMPEE